MKESIKTESAPENFCKAHPEFVNLPAMYKLIRYFLFMLDAEKAHHLTLRLLNVLMKIPFAHKIMKRCYAVEDKRLERNLFGLSFKNPVGLAAGLDKNAECIDAFAALGFGFMEIGTVTPLPQPGNDRPRLFRLIPDKAIINRMGFNNGGMEVVRQHIYDSHTAHKPSRMLIGGNIGKNKLTPNERAADDYLKCFEALFDVVDYFVVNVSSPNTPDLRALQEKEPLKKILLALQQRNKEKARSKPILLKIAPDLNNTQLDDIMEIVSETRLAGIVATNTTISREGLQTPKASVEKIGSGGLSGKPLSKRATEVIRYIHQHSEGKIPIIGVGGIMSVEDALEKLEAGASLVQLYTGFIYEGPALVKAINQRLIQ